MEESSMLSVVRAEFEEAKDQVREYTIDQIKGGLWFEHLLRRALTSYSEEVTAEYFEVKYPGLNRDAIVDRRIELAQRYAALSGGLSAGIYSGTVAATLGTLGGASAIAIPAGLAALMGDLLILSRVQLRLAYDLSVLYAHPVDLDDPEDLYGFIRVAFGVKAAESLQNAVLKLAPEATRQGATHMFRGATLHWVQALPVVGQHLLKRNIAKLAIPGVAVPLSTGLNYYTTGRIAQTAREIFRDRAVITEQARRVTAGEPDDPLLLLQVVWLVVNADRKTSEDEARFINTLAEELSQREGTEDSLEEFRAMVSSDAGEILRRLEDAPEASRESIYTAAIVASVLDRDLHRKEQVMLRRIAAAAALEYDPEKVEAIRQQFVL
jgi:hypothetical protein